MSQIIGGHTFVPLERNIDDVKLNSITGGAVITSELISTQTLSTSAVTGDQFLVLKAGGTLARILYDDLANSLGSASGMVSAITSVRLRSFNSLGNNAFECDQISCGTTIANANGKIIDRWSTGKGGTMVISAGQNAAASGDVCVPGTSFRISRSFYRITLTTAQASLGASDFIQVNQFVEGPNWRELALDVHSAQLLVRSSVSGLKFGFTLQDSPTTKTLTKLCTIPSANTWTLITLPNLPVWPAGNFNANSGVVGYVMLVVLAAGTTLTSPANDTWQTGSFNGAVGQSSFAAQAVNSTFDIGFIQHEPGSQCTTLIDCPFGVNLDGPMGCTRYFTKSYGYGVKPGTVDVSGTVAITVPASFHPYGYIPFKKRMAKVPTIAGWSPPTGAANAVRDESGVDRTISGANKVGESAFDGFTLSAVNAAATWYTIHYTADTGW